MSASENLAALDPGLQSAVSEALSGYVVGGILSTRIAIDDIRDIAPEIECSDEELVAIIVRSMIGQTSAISFDHSQ